MIPGCRSASKLQLQVADWLENLQSYLLLNKENVIDYSLYVTDCSLSQRPSKNAPFVNGEKVKTDQGHSQIGSKV